MPPLLSSRRYSMTRLASSLSIAFGVGLALFACELVTNSADFATVEPFVEAGIGCPASQTTCISEAGAISCANISTDNANCGGCGNPCAAGLVCSGGQCGSSCAAGETSCANGCVDITSDPDNCGGCQKPCTQGLVCSNSVCAAACAKGYKQCGSTCELQDYGTQCGACSNGAVCPAGSKCTIKGLCTAVPATCESTCDGACVDPLTDSKNCGSCGHACPSGGACVNGVCQSCTAGFDFCDGGCVDVFNSADNCGACGVACAAGKYCVEKSCVACPSMLLATATVCNNACVDLSTDATNCGKCNVRCPSGSCVNGACSK